MTSTEFLKRERRKIWMTNLQIAAGASILTATFFLFVAVLFALDALVHL